MQAQEIQKKNIFCFIIRIQILEAFSDYIKILLLQLNMISKLKLFKSFFIRLFRYFMFNIAPEKNPKKSMNMLQTHVEQKPQKIPSRQQTLSTSWIVLLSFATIQLIFIISNHAIFLLQKLINCLKLLWARPKKKTRQQLKEWKELEIMKSVFSPINYDVIAGWADKAIWPKIDGYTYWKPQHRNLLEFYWQNVSGKIFPSKARNLWFLKQLRKNLKIFFKTPSSSVTTAHNQFKFLLRSSILAVGYFYEVLILWSRIIL